MCPRGDQGQALPSPGSPDCGHHDLPFVGSANKKQPREDPAVPEPGPSAPQIARHRRTGVSAPPMGSWGAQQLYGARGLPRASHGHTSWKAGSPSSAALGRPWSRRPGDPAACSEVFWWPTQMPRHWSLGQGGVAWHGVVGWVGHVGPELRCPVPGSKKVSVSLRASAPTAGSQTLCLPTAAWPWCGTGLCRALRWGQGHGHYRRRSLQKPNPLCAPSPRLRSARAAAPAWSGLRTPTSTGPEGEALASQRGCTLTPTSSGGLP